MVNTADWQNYDLQCLSFFFKNIFMGSENCKGHNRRIRYFVDQFIKTVLVLHKVIFLAPQYLSSPSLALNPSNIGSSVFGMNRWFIWFAEPLQNLFSTLNCSSSMAWSFEVTKNCCWRYCVLICVKSNVQLDLKLCLLSDCTDKKRSHLTILMQI